MLDKVSLDINQALKAGDKPKAEALRLLKSSLVNAKIAAGHDLDEQESVKVIRKEIKSRVEARDLYRENNRKEQADKEEFERAIYSVYVPEELTVEAIDSIIAEQAANLGSDLSFSTLMPATIKAVAGKADGRAVSERVKEYISKAG